MTKTSADVAYVLSLMEKYDAIGYAQEEGGRAPEGGARDPEADKVEGRHEAAATARLRTQDSRSSENGRRSVGVSDGHSPSIEKVPCSTPSKHEGRAEVGAVIGKVLRVSGRSGPTGRSTSPGRSRPSSRAVNALTPREQEKLLAESTPRPRPTRRRKVGSASPLSPTP